MVLSSSKEGRQRISGLAEQICSVTAQHGNGRQEPDVRSWQLMAGLTLYDHAFSGNGWKVRTLFRHLRCPFNLRWVDILAGEQHEPWFRAKNPVGQIPVVEDETGRIWTESNAILETFAEGTPLLPEGHQRHQVRAWLNFEQT